MVHASPVELTRCCSTCGNKFILQPTYIQSHAPTGPHLDGLSRVDAQRLEPRRLLLAAAIQGSLELGVVAAHQLLLAPQRPVALLPLARVGGDLGAPVLQLLLCRMVGKQGRELVRAGCMAKAVLLEFCFLPARYITWYKQLAASHCCHVAVA
jgi:hypothetical protein